MKFFLRSTWNEATMKRPRSARAIRYLCSLLLAGGLITAGALRPAHAATCDAILEDLQTAFTSRDLDAGRRLAEAFRTNPDCPSNMQRRVGRSVALLHLSVANQNISAGSTLAQEEDLLREGLTFGEPWQLLATLGDIRNGAKDYGAATILYQRAINDLADTSTGSRTPPEEIIQRIHKLAQQTNMLAPQDAAIRTRSGEPGGIDVVRVRNIVIKRVARPIQFVFNEAVPTPEGEKQTRILFDILRNNQFPRIQLVGHTDHVGSDRYNLDLSIKRAEEVKRSLVRMGYDPSKINVTGRGERDPFDIVSGQGLSQDEIDQINRRVEYVRLDR